MSINSDREMKEKVDLVMKEVQNIFDKKTLKMDEDDKKHIGKVVYLLLDTVDRPIRVKLRIFQ